jgi:putative transposase
VPRPCSPEFRRRALDLVASGRTVRDVAASLGVAESCLYGWKSRDLVDRGPKRGTASTESAAPGEARRRIRELEEEVEILRAAASAVEKVVPPEVRYQLVAELVDGGVRARRVCLELGVSRSGFYDWRTWAPSPPAIRHAWSTDLISTVHVAPRATYGGRCVPTELVQGHGVHLGYTTVSLLMTRAGLAGLPVRKAGKRVPPSRTITDLVERTFHRDGPHQLWVTDTRRVTPPGRASCTAASSSTPTPAGSSAVQPTPGPAPSSPRTPWEWSSTPAATAAVRSPAV